MNSIALLLVLVAAVIHATWNLLAKRAGGGSLFVWLFTTLSSVALVPAAVIYLAVQQLSLGVTEVGFIAGTALLHLVYFILLQRAYQAGDLSLVYPIARGLGPALATLGAVLLLGERPTPLAIAGLLLIIVGMLILTWQPNAGRTDQRAAAILFGTLTGVTISVYSVWDKIAVSQIGIPPILLESFTGLAISIMLAPSAVRRWPEVQTLWRQRRLEAIGVAVFAPLSYILVLTAMAFTPLSYVAPCREVSILFATIIGARLLGEADAARRIFGACSMVAGVVALALG